MLPLSQYGRGSKVRVRIQRAFSARDLKFRSFLFCLSTAKKLVDRAKNLFNILKHLVIPETKNAIPLRIEIRRSNSILPRKLNVLSPVEFDDESSFDRAEVSEVRPDRMLTPEFEVLHPPASQVPPQDSFRVSLFATQSARIPLWRFDWKHGEDCLSVWNRKQDTQRTEFSEGRIRQNPKSRAEYARGMRTLSFDPLPNRERGRVGEETDSGPSLNSRNNQ